MGGKSLQWQRIKHDIRGVDSPEAMLRELLFLCHGGIDPLWLSGLISKKW